MTALPAAFTQALDSQREALNARYAHRLRTGVRIDGEKFLQHLRQTVAPLADKVDAVLPERTASVVAALFDVSLDLFAASLLGPDARLPCVAQVWSELLPGVIRLLAREPQQVAGCLSNAAFQISSQRCARPQAWLERMQRVAPACQSVAELLECGKVAAWMAGMVQYRAAALLAARSMRIPLAAELLGLAASTTAEQLSQVLSRLQNHPWLAVELAASDTRRSAITPVGTAGAFCGFGGLFVRPPTVRTVYDRLMVSDGKSEWELLADAYGAWFRRIGDAPARPAISSSQPDASIDVRGTIRWGKLSLAQPNLARATSFAAQGQTLAVTIATSHQVFLFSN